MKPWRLVLLLFVCGHAIGQNTVNDSLLKKLDKTTVDSSKSNLYFAISLANTNTDPDTAIYFAKKALFFSQKSNFILGETEAYFALGKAYLNVGETEQSLNSLQQGLNASSKIKTLSTRGTKAIANIYNSMGNTSFNFSKYKEALGYYTKALKLREVIKDSIGVIASYNNLGLIHYIKGDYKQALQNYFISLKKAEEINDEKGMALAYNNIGKVYMDQGQLDNAFVYFTKALEKAKKKNIPSSISAASYNIADILISKKKYEAALVNANIAYSIGKQTNNNINMANALDLMGQIYLSLKNYDKALEKEMEALKLSEDADNKINIVGVLISISRIYLEQKNYPKAIEFGVKSLALSQEIKSRTSTEIASNVLSECYAQTNNYQKAYEMERLSRIMHDSVLSETSQQELLKQSISYDYEKQALTDSLKYEADKKITTVKTQETLRAEQNKRIALWIGLALAVLFGAVLFNRFKITQKQKTTIEEQNHTLEITHHQLEETTKQIQDSILYSKEIQNIFLKSLVNENKYFKDALLIYKPKDVVSGDFYWYKEDGNNLYVVVGDCTGHGVPGAIISVLAIQSLEKVINNNTENLLLHTLSSQIREEFNAYYDKDRHVSIGLDYSVICLNRAEEKLYLSGSGSTILLKDKNNKIISESFESINIGGNMPVIYHPKTVFYDFNEIRSVFLYTDGVIDQRGGEKNKKFGTAQLKSLLENLNTNGTHETLVKIENTLLNWKGNNVQMDDITLLGLQVHAD